MCKCLGRKALTWFCKMKIVFVDEPEEPRKTIFLISKFSPSLPHLYLCLYLNAAKDIQAPVYSAITP